MWGSVCALAVNDYAVAVVLKLWFSTVESAIWCQCAGMLLCVAAVLCSLWCKLWVLLRGIQ